MNEQGEQMRRWFHNFNSKLIRRSAVAIVAAATVVSIGSYEFAKPANAAVAAPAAAPLDDHSAAALLSLDQAMEALAARVTPAVVNVTVTSKTNAKMSDGEESPDTQQFGPFNPFGGQFGMRPQP